MLKTAGIFLIAMTCVTAGDDTQAQQTKNLQRTEAEQAKASVAKVVSRQKLKDEKLRRELKVYVRDENRIYVNGTQISLELLKRVARKLKPSKVVLTAEPHVTLKRMTQIMDVIQQLGVKDLQFQVVKPGGKKVRPVEEPHAKKDQR